MLKTRKTAKALERLPIPKEQYRMHWIPVRVGSQDHEAVPSRQGNRLIYRDGRNVTL